MINSWLTFSLSCSGAVIYYIVVEIASLGNFMIFFSIMYLDLVYIYASQKFVISFICFIQVYFCLSKQSGSILGFFAEEYKAIYYVELYLIS